MFTYTWLTPAALQLLTKMNRQQQQLGSLAPYGPPTRATITTTPCKCCPTQPCTQMWSLHHAAVFQSHTPVHNTHTLQPALAMQHKSSTLSQLTCQHMQPPRVSTHVSTQTHTRGAYRLTTQRQSFGKQAALQTLTKTLELGAHMTSMLADMPRGVDQLVHTKQYANTCA